MVQPTIEQHQILLDQISQSGISAEAFQMLLESGQLGKLLDSFLGAPDYFVVDINYDLPLDDLIDAGGYSFIDGEYNDHSHLPPHEKSGVVRTRLRLVHLGHRFSTEGALAVLDARDFRPATIWEISALGVAYPDLQRKFPILALGSSYPAYKEQGESQYPVLLDENGDRIMYAFSPDDDGTWGGDDFRLLAVAK